MIMPQLDGYGVLGQLASMKLAKHPGVIALTALGRDDFITRAINLGACYYMVKPFDFAVLAQRVFEAAGEMERADAIGVRFRKEENQSLSYRRHSGTHQGLSVPARSGAYGDGESRTYGKNHQGTVPRYCA